MLFQLRLLFDRVHCKMAPLVALREARAAYAALYLLCVASLLQLAGGQGVWSELVNLVREDFDYQCPNGSVIVGLASVFRTAQLDRQWQYQCGSGRDNLANVSTTCTLQDPIDAVGADIEFQCPDNGYLGGFQSSFVSASYDRRWSPYCCQRPFASLVSCLHPTSGWENDIRDTLNFSAPEGHVVAGMTSFFFNRDRRWRYTTCVIEVNCTDPGTPANSQREGDSFLYRDTVTYTCNHGYYQSEGPDGGVRTCQQNGLWTGTPPVCTACTDIENCADIRCTNATDHTCHVCDSYYGTALGESAYENLVTECLPLCSWQRGFCSPGTCYDGLNSCNCSTGFAGPDCLDIMEPPDLLTCSLTLQATDRELQVDCSNSSALIPPLFTNILPEMLQADWTADFIGPALHSLTTPAYVEGVGVGVASSNVHTSLFRAANPLVAVSMVTLPCMDLAPTPDSPVSMSVCTSLADSAHLQNHTFLHGDTFVAEVTVINGGYLDVRNFDTLALHRHYYTGTPVLGAAKFILDVNPPVHCSVPPSSPCIVGQDLLQTGPGITDSLEVRVQWGGWLDEPAGIRSYTINVYRMSESGGVLRETLPAVARSKVNESEEIAYKSAFNVSEGAYSVVMTMMDVAGNVRHSRRVFLVDVTSQLLVDNSTSLRVESAVPETGFLWVNSTTTPLLVSGRGHFYNTHLRTQNLLAPVANYSPPIATEYDHPLYSGLYPRSGTPNALGVTQLRYHLSIDREGGMAEESLLEPAVFEHSTPDLGLEAAQLETAQLEDGDSVRVWFQASDYVNHVAVDSVLFHVDSSPPELYDLWLEWNGVTQLALHGTETLLDLNIEFSTRDPHSSIFSVQYWIGMEPDTMDVAWGQIPVLVTAQENCSHPECVCDTLQNCTLTHYTLSPLLSHFTSSHLTLHDTEYYITVMVTNHARLTSTLTHTITTDTTPPITGVVMDADLGSHDLDYTQNKTLTAWWADFFDRETSILLFQYHFGTLHANSSLFSYPLTEDTVVMETTATHATWTAPGPGTYYVTIVAYNHALQPSTPAYSDGITVDELAPVISEVIIAGVMETAGVMYISTDHHINISWSASDNVGIRDYHVAAISEEVWSGGERLNFSFAGRHQSFSLLNSDLLRNGNTFYVVVKATDLALHNTEITFGPVKIDVTPPVVHGNLTVESGQDHVTVTWQNDTFTDNESGIVSIEYSVGSSECGSQVMEFAPVPSSLPPLPCLTPHCLPILTSSLTLLTGHTYYITLRVRNAAGLESCIMSEGFTHIFGSPSGGRVIDLDPHSSEDSDDDEMCVSLHDSDTDLILDSDWITVRWEGFNHAHLNVTFSIGLGSIPGGDDVVPFQMIGTETRYSFTNLSLQHEQFYYVTVMATNDFGTTTSSSDGFLYLSGLEGVVSMTTVADGSEEGVDIDYQYSLSALSVQWACPPSLLSHISHYLWAVFQRDPVSSQLTVVREFENVGTQTSATAGGMDLRQGEVYVSGIQACLSTPIPTCLSPVYSDGVHILGHPVVSTVSATYTPLEWNEALSTSTYGKLLIEWSPFQDNRMAYYEWTIGTGDPGYELLTEWNHVEWYETSAMAYINATISLHKSNTVALQGYNAAGLYSRTGVELYWNVDREILPQNHIPRSKLIVYDIPEALVPDIGTTDWRELEYSEWDPIGMELDYTSSAHSLSAAWPDLRYTAYNYSVSTTPTFTACHSPGNIACGTTITNAVTIPFLELENGNRYYVCVQARRRYAIHQSPSTPHTLTACSNGVTVDLSPPIGSCVELRPLTLDTDFELASGGVASGSGLDGLTPFQTECVGNGSQYQVSSTDMHLVWSPFHDVEWYGNAVHATGVSYYEYAIGKQPGDSDVVPFTEVGVVNDVILTGLHLQSGHTCYATIRAHDFTDQWSEVTSPGITVDLTPPTGPSHFNLVNTDNTYSTVPLCVDLESGVTGMEIGLGSRPGSSDLLEWTVTSYGTGLETYINRSGIRDGQLVFASVQVWNGAGLSSIHYSLGHTHDSTPPSVGIVYDTLPDMSHDMSHDQDHTSSLSEISARWSEWSDPHTPIVEYSWAIGTCSSCNDVQDFLSVGVATAASREGFALIPGVTYHVTVKGCNLIGLCSEAASNGITVDVTPPITGWISDGLRGGDKDYQSSRSFIAAHWSGFHDTESSLHSYVVSAGIFPGDISLLSPTPLPPSTSSLLHPVTPPLPTNITVYVHIVAINNAGTMTTATSDGVFIDDTPPIVTNITMDTEWTGSQANTTQYSSTALRVTWNSDNMLSPVSSNSWAILSYPGTAIPLDTQTTNSRTSGTASGLQLSDGDSYSVIVTSCSAAGLCSLSQTSTPILMDSTPPVDGFFAVETSSTYPRSAAVPGGMAWRNRPRAGDSRITISFYGFSDAHSGISGYWAAVGTGFGQSDLTQGSQQLSPFQASENGSWTATVETAGHVTINQTLYLSLWAVNGVGLESRRVQGSFEVGEVEGETNRGTLHHIRSSLCHQMPTDSCLGHCTCAARGDLCTQTPSDFSTCVNVNVDEISEEGRVGVVNIAPQQTVTADDDKLFTLVTDKLVGRWEVPVPSPYQRLEWTVGERGASPGSGLFDTSVDHIWREAGDSVTAIFSVNPLYPLLDEETYVFHVRAWFNDTHYAQFQSSGITVDISGPLTVTGGRIREGGSATEIDYSSNQTNIDVTWNGVFIPKLSGVHSTYQIGIGDVPGSDNVLGFSPIPSHLTSATLSASLTHGNQYYTTLRATSPLLVTIDTISDGFTVDATPPKVGVVFDGLDYWDRISQSDTKSLSARWTGFHDEESGIHHYEMAMSESPIPAVDLEYENMGIGLRWTLTELDLNHGTVYYVHVVAVNNAGVRSLSVASNGRLVDVTRPEQLRCEWESLNITSFEPISTGSSPCNDSIGTPYDVVLLPPSPSFSPLSGCVSPQLATSLSLPLTTKAGTLYTFSFWLARQPGESGCGHKTPLLARVVAPGLEEVVSVHTRNGDQLHRWSRFQFQFTAAGPSSILRLSTLSNRYRIVFDELSVSQCHTTTPVPFDDVITNRSSVFHVSQEHMSGMWTRLRAWWEVGEVGGAKEYQWAVGTTERGEQLQPFTSTGSIPYGVSGELATFHTQRLYITVLVWNQAGMETVVYGGPYVVDMTPPEAGQGGGVRDGVNGEDMDYQSSATLQADWSDVSDPESGIEECSFMIGTAASQGDLYPHTPTTGTSSHVTLPHVSHGTVAVTTLTCRNAAGLQATFYSDGVTILQTPPTNDSAYLAVSSPLQTVYPSRDSHVASQNVTLRWGGFTEPAATSLHYEVCVGERGSGECVMVGSDKMLIIDGVGGASSEEVSVTAINMAGLRSSPLRGRVEFQTTPPVDTGAAINATWINGSLHFDWTHTFTSPSPLTFELSLGTLAGSGIIRKWVELGTDHTHYTVTDSRLSETGDYFLTVVAISLSGLHTTASNMVAGTPLTT